MAGDWVEEFDDGVVSPWMIYHPTVYEVGGLVHFTNPGTVMEGDLDGYHYRVEMSQMAIDYAEDGAGDFTGVSQWTPVVPAENQVYQMGVGYTLVPDPYQGVDIAVSVANLDTVIAGMLGIPSGLGIAFSRIGNTQLEDYVVQYAPIVEGDITGDIFLQLTFDDTLDQFTAAFSLDGGATHQSPFAPLGWGIDTPARFQGRFSGMSVDLRPIPEPSSIALVGLALAGLAGCVRKRWLSGPRER
jgi:hypothetical protein